MSHLLVCTDGSLYDPSVCDHAAWAAQRLDLPIRVLHMLDPKHAEIAQRSNHGGYVTKSPSLDEITKVQTAKAQLAHKQGKSILSDARSRLNYLGSKDISTALENGRLSDYVEREGENCGFIVIGKRGNHADFAKGHLGSNLERVLRTSRQPTLVASREHVPIKSAVIAFDGGPSVKRAIQFAAESPLLSGMALHIIRVGEPNPKLDQAMAEAGFALKNAGHSVHLETLPGEPETVITDVLSANDARLLIMGAFGHNRIRHFILGSTTTALIREVKVPVLVIH